MKGVQLNTNSTSTFDTDLLEAHEKENLFGKIFSESRHNCEITTSQDKGSFSDWDVKIYFTDHKKELTFEVKQDKMTQSTGNIAVEYQRTLKSGEIRPTCISISKADVWAYWVANSFWLIDTESLRQMIADKKYKADISGAGEGNRASVYLFDKKVFFKHAEPIKNYL
jgi:hypothetical protein